MMKRKLIYLFPHPTISMNNYLQELQTKIIGLAGPEIPQEVESALSSRPSTLLFSSIGEL